jgi:membrane protein YqaA with SNARE-associated domain
MGLAALIVLATIKAFRHWVFRLGGLGLILVALIDNSFIPIPGGLDVFTILLSSGRHDLWWYYVLMSTVGSVIGAYLTYRIGEKGGEEVLERKIGKQRADKVYKRVESAGLTSVVVSVLIPPPFPIVPVLLAAGALKMPVRKFLSGIALGRAIRFTIDALLGIFFGRPIVRFFAQYYKPALYTLIGLAIIGGIGGLIYYKRWKAKRADHRKSPQPQPRTNAA